MKLNYISVLFLCSGSSLVLGQLPEQPTPKAGIDLSGDPFFQFETYSGRAYFMQLSETLTSDSWIYIPEVLNGDENTKQMGTNSTANKLFFRLKTMDYAGDAKIADFDNDGIANQLELEILQTDPFLSNTDGVGDEDGVDTDNDQMPDALELHFFGNLTSHTGSGDADNDGLTNAEELQLATDPTVNEQSVTDNNVNYSYDPVGRLTGASGVSSATYQYDFEGNITSSQ